MPGNNSEGETLFTSIVVKPNPLLFWVTNKLDVTDKIFQGKEQKTILGLIPAGSKIVTVPLRQIAQTSVTTRYEVKQLMIGAIAVLVGLGIIGNSPLLALLLVIIGAALIAGGLTTSLVIINVSGHSQAILVSLFDRTKLKEFSGHINTKIVNL